MGLIADIIDGFRFGFETVIRTLIDPLGIAPDPTSEPTDDDARNEAERLVDQFAGEIFDAAEDEVIEPLAERGTLTPDNVEGAIDDAEGNAIQLALTALTSVSALEIAGGTQLETHEEMITEAMTLLALEDVLGANHQMWFEKGVAPALEARVARETRSEYVDLQDAVEQQLRNKDSDDGYLSGLGTYGIRPDQVPILEEVAINDMEFEELIETPAELGLVVPDDVLEDELDRSGYAEPTKAFLSQVNDEISRSNRVWEERTAVEPLVQELETLVADEEISADVAVDLLPDEAEIAEDALRDRFANLQTVPAGSPTRSQIENSFAAGYTDLATLRERLERLEYDTEEYDDVVRETVLSELEGGLQEALAMGLITEAQYGEYMDFAGINEQAQQALMAGQSFGDIVDSQLGGTAGGGSQPVAVIPGIGQSRSTALNAIGIETLADLAQADPEAVADAAQVSPETAEDWISLAQQAT